MVKSLADPSMERAKNWILAKCIGVALVLTMLAGLMTPARTQDDRMSTPFSRPQYLIHLTGTNTSGGFVKKDVYLLIDVQPQNGVWISPDGTGGTFTNTVELIAGPLRTPREVCASASGLKTQSFEAWNSNRSFFCSDQTGGGSQSWWERQSFGIKSIVVGGVIAAVLLGGWAILSVMGGGGAAVAASSITLAAEELVTVLGTEKLLKESGKLLARRIAKMLLKKLGRKATIEEVRAVTFETINAELVKRGMARWSAAQFDVFWDFVGRI